MPRPEPRPTLRPAARPGSARPQRSTLARAVLPVVGGLGFFALLGLATWGIAALISRNPENVNERLAVDTFEVGDTESIANVIADGGPLIFPDLVRSGGTRTVVLDHLGDDPTRNWRVYYAYPADRSLDCKVVQVRGTRDFTDCDGRTIPVEALAPPEGVVPIVGDTVTIDLRSANAASTTTVPDSTVATSSTG